MQIEISQIAKEIYESGKRLNEGYKALFKLASDMAKAEEVYRRELGITEEKLKLEGMQITLIGDVARGRTAELKYQRDLSEARYKAAIYSLQAIQSQMNGLQSILKNFEEV